MSRKLTLTWIVVFFLTMSCARREAVGDAKPVVVRGSQSMRWLMRQLADRYAIRHPGRDVEVHATGTGKGIAALAEGKADVAGATRLMSASERMRLGESVSEMPLAAEAAVVFVHPSNPIDTLSVDQIRAIFTGSVRFWSELGGPRERIAVIDRIDTDGTHDVHDFFRAVALRGSPFASHAEQRQHSYQIVNAVGVNPFAIGYARANDIDPKVVRVIRIATSSGTAIAYSEDAVRRGEYPLARRFIFYSVGGDSGRVHDFLAWCRTDEAATLIRRGGLITLRP